MYLKTIYINGFKSFADKINLSVEQGITCVVGPNGSGKSNIVDAIKWVLGEQSIKSLRGNKTMTDVIFTGSKTRSAQNRAVVALTFDNTDHYLHNEQTEIEVKRVLYQSGETEYYLNNQKVRLKDITDLFIDSGANKESFNIISQGAIADIINSHPEERRVIIEEAAGVLKYKKRKEESLKKLLKTKDNLSKVDLLINELKTTIEPLASQSKQAETYLAVKRNLEDIELGLIVQDITQYNSELNKAKELLKSVNDDLSDALRGTDHDDAQSEKLRFNLIKIDEELNNYNQQLTVINEELVALATAKQISLERQKYQYETVKIDQHLIALQEQSLALKNNLHNYDLDLEKIIKEIEQINNDKDQLEKEKAAVKDQLLKLTNQKQTNLNLNYSLNNQIEVCKRNIEENNLLPYAVKKVLENKQLNGICGYLAGLINVPETYAAALETALGANNSVLVVDNEKVAQNAIEYLKTNNFGRATFFPLNIIKKRFIDHDTLKLLKNEPDYIGVLGDLVTFASQYEGVILNQIGNVIVVQDLNAMHKIGRLINYQYRIVTIAGDIQYSGGAIAGGSVKTKASIISQKFELEKLTKELSQNNEDNKQLEDSITKLQAQLTKLANNEENLVKALISSQEKIFQKEYLKNEIVVKEQEINNELKGIKGIKENKLEEEITKIINDYYQKEGSKQELEKKIMFTKQKRQELTDELMNIEKTNKEYNISYNRLLNEQKNLEVKIAKLEVNLDNLLLSLNEDYSMTYEKAAANYLLELPIVEARTLVEQYKKELKSIGEVNIGAISEYERLNKRYTFLTEQKADLELSLNSLNEIIMEMDEIMVSKFKTTFDQIADEFAKTFKKLFKGGQGLLRLTNNSDLLTTGIEIIAEPPGKKLSSIALLSNGEKSLTAIALLFAILNIRPAPFCVLDEVEAALDEANVNTFGNYLKENKDKSQFIIITHKKKTMEYADILYGITMQESGVSKLVSVKLED